MYCWGSNFSSQLGNGETPVEPVTHPIRAAEGIHFGTMMVGGELTCGIDFQLEARCWGSSSYAEAGAGPVGIAGRTPTKVAVPQTGRAHYKYGQQ